MREPIDRFISDLSSVCRFVCGLISVKLDLAPSGHEGFIYGSSHSKYPPAKPGALRLLAPQRGLIATGKEQENLKPVDRTRIALLPQARIHDRNADSRKCQTLGVPRQGRGFT